MCGCVGVCVGVCGCVWVCGGVCGWVGVGVGGLVGVGVMLSGRFSGEINRWGGCSLKNDNEDKVVIRKQSFLLYIAPKLISTLKRKLISRFHHN